MEIDHSLNKTNIKKFIKASDKKIRPIVEKIIDNTTYISFKEFKKTLFKTFKRFIKDMNEKKIKSIYVYKTKNFYNKSNYWIYKLLLNYIKKHNYKFKFILVSKNTIKKLKPNDTIIITDDCSYSGSQIQTNIIRNLGKNKKQKTFLNIYIICPYMSSLAVKAITYPEDQKELNYKIKIGYHKKLDNYLSSKFLTNDEIKTIEGYYSNLNPADMTNDDDDLYSVEFLNFLVYFNHKLADYASTITLFYMGVMPNTHNKMILKERTKKGNKSGNLNLQVIPLIKNCNYNIGNINVNYPMCPHPPYKKKNEYK